MNARESIISKQVNWALNEGIKLIGSKEGRGERNYTAETNVNLFQPLTPEVERSFIAGDGNEINSSSENPSKMQALHSSSAIGVNIFQYWQMIDQPSAIAAACGFCRAGNDVSQNIVFEDKYPVDDKFQTPPNIDVVFHNQDNAQFKRFAVECKFTEAYSKRKVKHTSMSKYLDIQAIWEDIPHIQDFSRSIDPVDNSFIFLDAAQLIKHILGLIRACGKNNFRLMYLWYDALGEPGYLHRKEIHTFAEVCKADKVKFHSMSYQELIITLSKKFRDDHKEYIQYISSRYL